MIQSTDDLKDPRFISISEVEKILNSGKKNFDTFDRDYSRLSEFFTEYNY